MSYRAAKFEQALKDIRDDVEALIKIAAANAERPWRRSISPSKRSSEP